FGNHRCPGLLCRRIPGTLEACIVQRSQRSYWRTAMQTELSLSTVTATQEQVDTMLRELLPAQGQWSEADYLWLTDHTARLIEFTDGYLEVLPMPTDEHQTMVLLLYELLVAFVRPRGGKVLVAPLRLKIRDGKYREPDIVLVRSARDPRRQHRCWLGADLGV